MTLADTGTEPEIHAPMPWDLVPVPYIAAAVVILVLVALLTGAVRRSLPGSRRRPLLPLRWRAKLRLHPGPGWVGEWERWRSLGLPQARKVAKAARPSLTWWARHKPGGWREYATHIGYAWGWVVRRRVVATSEDVVITFAGPRRGKSQSSADRMVDAPGKVVATSIRDDALKATIGPRSEKGTVHVWNPEGLGSYGSTLRWSPVTGCQDPQVAIRRAGYMIESQTSRGLSDADFWSDQASVALAGLLHAAAMAGYTMDDVYTWALGNDTTPVRILREALGANPAQRDDVANFLESMPERTKSSVATTLRRTLQFMRSPDVSSMLSPHPDPAVEMTRPTWFDVEEFLLGPGADTLYLISAGDDAVTQPLFSALIAEIAYTVRHGAAKMPGGRLDPPLDFEGDEIANVAPIPVHRWASWMGGCGIRMRIYAQSWSQLVERYGQLANSLWACASMIVVYGGTTETELLDRVRKLGGSVQVRGKDQVHKSRDAQGNLVKEKVPTYEHMDLIPASELRLPRHVAVVLSTDVPPVLVTTAKAWKRRDIRRWRGRTPDCVVAPTRREVPDVDTGLRKRIEQKQWEPKQMPLHLVSAATGTDDAVAQTGPSEADEAEPTKDSKEAAAAVPTQPMPSMRSRARERAPRPEPTSTGRGTPPRLRPRSTPAAPPKSGSAPGGLHPAPWDLPRSEPIPPAPADDGTNSQDAPLRPGRLPWDEE